MRHRHPALDAGAALTAPRVTYTFSRSVLSPKRRALLQVPPTTSCGLLASCPSESPSRGLRRPAHTAASPRATMSSQEPRWLPGLLTERHSAPRPRLRQEHDAPRKHPEERCGPEGSNRTAHAVTTASSRAPRRRPRSLHNSPRQALMAPGLLRDAILAPELCGGATPSLRSASSREPHIGPRGSGMSPPFLRAHVYPDAGRA